MCVWMCVHGSLLQSAGESLIGKKVGNETCRLPDVSVKAVSAGPRRGVGGLRVLHRDPGPGPPAGHLASCLAPAQLLTSACSFSFSVFRLALHVARFSSSSPLFTVKYKCRAGSVFAANQT